MDLNHLTGIFLAPREIGAFAPIAMDAPGRQAAGEPDARPATPLEDRQDTFTLSERGRTAAALEDPGAIQNEQVRVEPRPEEEPEPRGEPRAEADKPRNDPASELSPEEQRMLDELRQTDQKVRAHEQAHAAAGGTNVRYEYQTGPDGRQYAVGGTTDIQVQAQSNDPAAKLDQARKLRSAALAPADPSSQDLAVSAKASRLEMDARREMAQAELEEMVRSSEAAPSNGWNLI